MAALGTLTTDDAEVIENLVRRVGAELLRWRPRNSPRTDLDIVEKVDGSLVSAADHAAQELFFAEFSHFFPGEPILSEEGVLNGDGRSERSWILDPLDGTKEFLKGSPDFAVQLACCLNGSAVGGWVYFPALDCLVVSNDGMTAFRDKQVLSIRDRKTLEPSRVLVRGIQCLDPRATHPIIDTQVALRRFLAGELDIIIIRLGQLGVWDVAGGSILVEAAGGVACNGEGLRPRFGASIPPEEFVIFSLPSLKEAALEIAGSLKETKGCHGEKMG